MKTLIIILLFLLISSCASVPEYICAEEMNARVEIGEFSYNSDSTVATGLGHYHGRHYYKSSSTNIYGGVLYRRLY